MALLGEPVPWPYLWTVRIRKELETPKVDLCKDVYTEGGGQINPPPLPTNFQAKKWKYHKYVPLSKKLCLIFLLWDVAHPIFSCLWSFSSTFNFLLSPPPLKKPIYASQSIYIWVKYTGQFIQKLKHTLTQYSQHYPLP